MRIFSAFSASSVEQGERSYAHEGGDASTFFDTEVLYTGKR